MRVLCISATLPYVIQIKHGCLHCTIRKYGVEFTAFVIVVSFFNTWSLYTNPVTNVVDHHCSCTHTYVVA